MSVRLSKTVVLVGMMGAGKTAVGGALARLLDVPFADMDTEIEKAASMSVADIFERDGETFFRERETAVLGRLLEGPPHVLSTGGGAFHRVENRELIGKFAKSVWIKADFNLLWNRVKHKTTRPLLRAPNPKAILRELYDKRQAGYALADVVVEAQSDITIENMAKRMANALEEAGVIDGDPANDA